MTPKRSLLQIAGGALLLACGILQLEGRQLESLSTPPPPSAAAGGSQIITPEGDVTLFVRVTDKKGVPITGIKSTEVRLFENGREQKIESFTYDSSNGVIIGVLVDVSGSRHQDEKAQKKEISAISDFLDNGLSTQDAAYIAAFNERIYLATDLTKKREDFDRGLQKIVAFVPRGSTALYDAICSSADAQLPGQSRHRALLVLSDFDENGSKHTLDETIRKVQETGTDLFCLVDDMSSYTQWSKKTRRRAEENVKELCDETGGTVFRFDSMDALKSALQHIKSDLHGFYIIRYQTTDKTHDGKHRKLKVVVERKNVRITGSHGYFAPKD
jgi:Ca-activated chloride channel homolog